MNETKSLIEKTKKKTIEQSGVRKGSPMEGVGCWGLCREEFQEKYPFEFRVEKSIGVMDNNSGDELMMGRHSRVGHGSLFQDPTRPAPCPE